MFTSRYRGKIKVNYEDEKMKGKITLGILVTAIMSLTSCDGGIPTSPDGKTLIKFFGWGSTSEQEIFATMISEFKQVYTDYDVIYTSTSSETFMTTLAGYRDAPKNMPDVFYMPDTSFVQWINSRNNIMLDLTDYIEESDIMSIENSWEQGIDAYRFDSESKKLGTGGIYGLPKDLGPNALTYNKTIVLSKGITIVSDPNGDYGYNPQTKTLNDKVAMTWAQFVRFCEDTKTGDIRNDSNSIVGITHYPLEAAYLSNNGNFLADGYKTVNINNNAFAESLQFVADLSNEYNVMTTAEGQQTQNGLQRFTSGLAAASFIGVWETPNLWKCDFDWDVLYTPVPNQSGDLSNWQEGYRTGCSSQSFLGSVALSVYKDSKVKEGAYKLAEFLTFHPTAQRINYKLGQAVPNIVDMANGEYLTEELNDESGLNRPANREVYTHMMLHSQRRPQAYTYNDEWWNEMWESSADETKLYRVWYDQTSSYGTHLDVWNWNTKSRVNNSFLNDLQSSCQAKLDTTTSRYSW